MKRARLSLSDDEDAESTNAPLDGSSPAEKPRTDATYGQKSAFPGVDDEGECSDEDTVNALQYLRSVRSEAHGIPNLICAAKTPEEEETRPHDSRNAESRGYYSDGAYVAAPVLGPVRPSGNWAHVASNSHSAPELVDAQDAYHVALLERFDAFSSALRAQALPPRSSTDPPRHSYFDRRKSKAEKSRWTRLLKDHAPNLSDITSLDQAMVLSILELATERCLVFPAVWDLGHQKRLGAWIWALLGKLGELGTLSNDEVSVVRELAKKAVAVAQTLKQHPKYQTLNPGSRQLGDDPKDELSRHKASLLARLDVQEEGVDGLFGEQPREDAGNDAVETTESCQHVEQDRSTIETSHQPRRRRNTSSPLSDQEENGHKGAPSDHEGTGETQQVITATLDMVITIAGERYGQRDLLQGREVLWEPQLPPDI